MHPLVLQTGALGLNAFGVLACIALVAGALWTRASARRRGASESDALQAYVVASLGALVAAHIGYAVGNLASSEPARSLLGLHGSAGLVGALGASRLHFRGRSGAWRAWLDAQAPLLGLLLCAGQLGCYLFGTDYGSPLPLAAPRWLERLGSYPRWTSGATIEALGPGAPAWLNQMSQHLLEPDSRYSLPLHPTQLYIGVAGLLLMGGVMRGHGRRRFSGEGFLLALMAYALLMVVFEPLRADPRRGTLPLQASNVTWLALGLGVLSAAVIHGPLSARGSQRSRRLISSLVVALSLSCVIVSSRAATSADHPLALGPLLALALAWCAAVAWRSWCKLATRATDAHIGVSSGPRVPASSAPGGPLQ
jgi:phosphatidylglycerol---prolipoprotein diacylglyceryl transferase